MYRLAVQLRLLQLFGQNAHNLVAGNTFLPDHEMLGMIYEAAASDYDNVVERCIGLGRNPDLLQLQVDTVVLLKKLPVTSDCSVLLSSILKLEQELCTLCESVCKGKEATEGVRQLIGDIADKSEGRQYKLKQRLAKEQSKG